MAGKTAILAVRIIGDASGADRAIQQTSTAADRMGKRMQTASRVAALGLAALAAAAISGAKAAAEDEKSQALLAQTMQKNAGATQAQIKATENWISAQSRAKGVADDQLRPALGALVRATGDTATAQDALRVAMDVSAATGKPLQSVSAALSKAYGGQTTALGRLIPGLDKTILASGDMNAIMAELARTTGGAAATAAETAQGKYERMKVTLGELQENLAAVLLPVMGQFADILGRAATFAEQHTTAVQVTVAVLAGLAVAVLAVNAAMKVYAATQIALRAATIVMRNAQIALNIAMMANPIGLVIAAVLLLIAGFVLLYKNSETFRGAVQAVGRAGQAAIGWIVSKASELWGWFSSKLPGALEAAKSVAVRTFNAYTAPIRFVIGLIEDLVGWIRRIKWPSVPAAIARLFGKGGPPSTASPGAGGGGGGAYSTLPGKGGPGGGGFFTSVGGGQTPTIIQITVNGALDPDAVAQQIGKLLAGRNLRLGRV